MRAVALGIEHALGRAGGAGGRVGEHTPDLRLGAEQQPRRIVRQVLVRREGKRSEGGKRAQMIGQIAVKAAALFFTRKQSVELFKLHFLDACAADILEALLRKQESVDPGKTHR